MTFGVDISLLKNQDLSALEQEILVEESRRVMNSSSAIVVEPDAPEKSHQDAIKKLLDVHNKTINVYGKIPSE